MITTILLVFSLLGILAMLGWKAFEIKVRKIEKLAELSLKGDTHLHRLIDSVVFKYNRYKTIATIFFTEFLPAYLYELLTKGKDFVAERYYKAGDQFRGKRILRNSGSVSTFLRNITDDMENRKV